MCISVGKSSETGMLFRNSNRKPISNFLQIRKDKVVRVRSFLLTFLLQVPTAKIELENLQVSSQSLQFQPSYHLSNKCRVVFQQRVKINHAQLINRNMLHSVPNCTCQTHHCNMQYPFLQVCNNDTQTKLTVYKSRKKRWNECKTSRRAITPPHTLPLLTMQAKATAAAGDIHLPLLLFMYPDIHHTVPTSAKSFLITCTQT